MEALVRDELRAGLQLQKAAKASLAALIQQSAVLERNQDTAVATADHLATLRQEVEMLRQEKNELQAQLAGRGPTTLRSKIVQELAALKESLGSQASGARPLDRVSGEAVERAARRDLKRKAEADVLVAYRLSGASLFRLPGGRLGVRLETFHDGRFFETYYVLLRAVGSELRIERHTVPAFVPLDALASRWLATDPHAFCSALSDHLAAFVTRREHVQAALALLPGATARTSPACDFVEMRGSVGGHELVLRVVVTDVLQSTVSHARIQVGGVRRPALEAHMTNATILDGLQAVLRALR